MMLETTQKELIFNRRLDDSSGINGCQGLYNGTRQLRLHTYGMSEKEIECIVALTKLLAGIKYEWYVYASPCLHL